MAFDRGPVHSMSNESVIGYPIPYGKDLLIAQLRSGPDAVGILRCKLAVPHNESAHHELGVQSIHIRLWQG